MKWLLIILSVLIVAACGGGDATDMPGETSQAPAPSTTAALTETVAADSAGEATTSTTIEVTTTTTEAPAVVSEAALATIAAYETTWNDGNEDAFRALFAPGAALEDSNETRSGDVDWLVQQSAGRLMAEISLSIDGCSVSGEAVACEAEFDGAVPIAMNWMPWRDQYTFSIADGLITHIAVKCIICWDGDAEDRFAAWVQTVHEPHSAGNYGYILLHSAEKAAYWLEWAPKWQEAGRP